MRLLLQYVLPIVLPTLVYFAWLWFRSGKSQEELEAEEKKPHPWLWLAIAGIVLMFVAIWVAAMQQGAPPDSVYTPPHMENGVLVPGTMEPRK